MQRIATSLAAVLLLTNAVMQASGQDSVPARTTKLTAAESSASPLSLSRIPMSVYQQLGLSQSFEFDEENAGGKPAVHVVNAKQLESIDAKLAESQQVIGLRVLPDNLTHGKFSVVESTDIQHKQVEGRDAKVYRRIGDFEIRQRSDNVNDRLNFDVHFTPVNARGDAVKIRFNVPVNDSLAATAAIGVLPQKHDVILLSYLIGRGLATAEPKISQTGARREPKSAANAEAEILAAGVGSVSAKKYAQIVEKLGVPQNVERATKQPSVNSFKVSVADLVSGWISDEGEFDWASEHVEVSKLGSKPLVVRAERPREDGESRWNVQQQETFFSLSKQAVVGAALRLVAKTEVPWLKNMKTSTAIELARHKGVLLTIPDGDRYLCYWAVRTTLDRTESAHETAQSVPDPSNVAVSHAKQTATQDSPHFVTQPPPAPNADAQQIMIKALVSDMTDDVFEDLQDALTMKAGRNGAMLKISAKDVEQLSQFIEKHRKNDEARVLSRPTLVTHAGKPANLMVGGEMPILVPAGSGTNSVEYKSFGLQLGVTVRNTAHGKQFIDWNLSNTSRLHTEEGQGVRSQYGFDGCATIAAGDAILVATRTVIDDEKRWLVATLLPANVESLNNDVAVTDKELDTLPSATYLDDDVQYFPAGPEVKLKKQIKAVRDDLSKKYRSAELLASQVPVVASGRVFRISTQAAKFEATERQTFTLESPLRIRKVLDFDATLIQVEPVGGDPCKLHVKSLREGVTDIRIVYEDDSEVVIGYSVKASDGGLGLHLQRLYPNRKLEVYPINGSVLLRGTVRDSDEARHVTDIADQFFPYVLNQLTIEERRAPGDRTENQGERIQEFRKWAKSIQALRKTQRQSRIEISGATKPSFLLEGRTYTIVCPEQIRSCDGYDEDVLTVSAVSGQPTEIKVTPKRGQTVLRISGEKKTWTLDVLAEGDVAHLTSVANRLYPNRELVFMQFGDAVQICGIVPTKAEANQIVTVAEQFYPQVLNHLIVAPNQPPAPDTPVPAETRSPLPVQRSPKTPPAPAFRTPVVPASLPNTRDGEIKAIRSEIKALHEDVRGLIRILKDRGMQKQIQQSSVKPSKAKPLAIKTAGTQLLYFHADYCKPCQQMNPIVEKLAVEFAGGNVQRIDITRQPELTRRFKVDRIPTFVLARDGELITREVGIQSESRLRSLLRSSVWSGRNSRPASETSPAFNPGPNESQVSVSFNEVPSNVRSGVWLVPVFKASRTNDDYLKLVGKAAGKVGVPVSVTVTAKSEFSDRMKIISFPTLLLMKDGEEVDRLSGPATEKQLTAFIHTCDSYLSRAEVPFNEDAVVALRRINEHGQQIHALDYDVGFIIASEPGRSIIAVPAGAIDRNEAQERMLVYLFPGTEREKAVPADVKWDLAAFSELERGKLPEEFTSAWVKNVFALLEIQHADKLPVCKPAKSPANWWDETAQPPGTKSLVGDGESFAVYRPRSINGEHRNPYGNARRDSESNWVSVLCRHNKRDWTNDDSGHSHFRFKADFTGAVIGINKAGQFVGFGRAIPQNQMFSISSVDWGRSTIHLTGAMDYWLGSCFGTEQHQEKDAALNDPLVLTAIDPDVVASIRRQWIRDQRRAAMPNILKQLGLQIDDLSKANDAGKLASPFDGGMLLSRVQPNSPAAKAGLRSHDVLLGLNNYETLNSSNLKFVLQDSAKKGLIQLKFVISRKGQAFYGTIDISGADLSLLETQSAIEQTSAEPLVRRLKTPDDVVDIRKPFEK